MLIIGKNPAAVSYYPYPMICSSYLWKSKKNMFDASHIIPYQNHHLTTHYLHNFLPNTYDIPTLFVVRFLFCIKNSYKNIVTEVYYFTFTFKQHMWIYVWIEFWSYHWILRYLQNNCIAIEDLGDTYIFYIFKW